MKKAALVTENIVRAQRLEMCAPGVRQPMSTKKNVIKKEAVIVVTEEDKKIADKILAEPLTAVENSPSESQKTAENNASSEKSESDNDDENEENDNTAEEDEGDAESNENEEHSYNDMAEEDEEDDDVSDTTYTLANVDNTGVERRRMATRRSTLVSDSAQEDGEDEDGTERESDGDESENSNEEDDDEDVQSKEESQLVLAARTLKTDHVSKDDEHPTVTADPDATQKYNHQQDVEMNDDDEKHDHEVSVYSQQTLIDSAMNRDLDNTPVLDEPLLSKEIPSVSVGKTHVLPSIEGATADTSADPTAVTPALGAGVLQKERIADFVPKLLENKIHDGDDEVPRGEDNGSVPPPNSSQGKEYEPEHGQEEGEQHKNHDESNHSHSESSDSDITTNA
ncbi:hypothetical protein RRG08_034722 [Elysia crispata]|uniref:Uncharacterized protein n=1 Tax=Elysia crispata TaxID=231223 RepID=A0AAE1B1X2_9GAST|nr:hypothetical protein RRG08_034722 [Elysia crispata]